MKAEVPGPVLRQGCIQTEKYCPDSSSALRGSSHFCSHLLSSWHASYFDNLSSLWERQTGGFTVHNDGIAHYGSSLITYPVSTFWFGVNFNLYYYLMLRRVKAFFEMKNFCTYVIIVLVSTGLITNTFTFTKVSLRV